MAVPYRHGGADPRDRPEDMSPAMTTRRGFIQRGSGPAGRN